MADKKEGIWSDPTKDIREISANLSNRITVLEAKNHEMEEVAVKQSYELTAHVEDFDREIAALKKDTAEISDSIDDIHRRLMQSVTALRRSGKTDNFAKLQRNLEDFKPEQWITREELVRMVKRRL